MEPRKVLEPRKAWEPRRKRMLLHWCYMCFCLTFRNSGGFGAKKVDKSSFAAAESRVKRSEQEAEQEAEEAVDDHPEVVSARLTYVKREVGKMDEAKREQAERLGMGIGAGRSSAIHSHSTKSTMQVIEQTGSETTRYPSWPVCCLRVHGCSHDVSSKGLIDSDPSAGNSGWSRFVSYFFHGCCADPCVCSMSSEMQSLSVRSTTRCHIDVPPATHMLMQMTRATSSQTLTSRPIDIRIRLLAQRSDKISSCSACSSILLTRQQLEQTHASTSIVFVCSRLYVCIL